MQSKQTIDDSIMYFMYNKDRLPSEQHVDKSTVDNSTVDKSTIYMLYNKDCIPMIKDLKKKLLESEEKVKELEELKELIHIKYSLEHSLQYSMEHSNNPDNLLDLKHLLKKEILDLRILKKTVELKKSGNGSTPRRFSIEYIMNKKKVIYMCETEDAKDAIEMIYAHIKSIHCEAFFEGMLEDIKVENI